LGRYLQFSPSLHFILGFGLINAISLFFEWTKGHFLPLVHLSPKRHNLFSAISIFIGKTRYLSEKITAVCLLKNVVV
jgi:hypothetical protein